MSMYSSSWHGIEKNFLYGLQIMTICFKRRNDEDCLISLSQNHFQGRGFNREKNSAAFAYTKYFLHLLLDKKPNGILTHSRTHAFSGSPWNDNFPYHNLLRALQITPSSCLHSRKTSLPSHWSDDARYWGAKSYPKPVDPSGVCVFWHEPTPNPADLTTYWALHCIWSNRHYRSRLDLVYRRDGSAFLSMTEQARLDTNPLFLSHMHLMRCFVDNFGTLAMQCLSFRSTW